MVEPGESRWSVAASYNRRLVAFRLLSIFYPEKFRRMQFHSVPLASVSKWFHPTGRPYMSTDCGGIWAEIRYQRFVGQNREPQGHDVKGMRWPDAVDLFRKIKKVPAIT